jgi:DNA-binding response OmpR family regulator
MHVSKVRRKLGDSEEDGNHIKTIRGVGYMFARPAKAKK